MASRKIMIEKLGADLEETKSEFKDYIEKSSNTMDALETMISREHGATATYNSLIRDFNRIGDPYFHNTYVRKSIDKRSDNIAGTKIAIHDAKGNELPDSNPAVKLFNYINDDDSRFDFFFDINRSLDRSGKAFIVSSEEKRRDGLPQIMYTIEADNVEAKVNNGVLDYWEYKEGKKKTKLPKDRVLFIRYKHPTDQFDGLAPGSSTIKEILQDFYAQAYNIKFFQQGAQGKGAWKSKDGFDLSPKQRQEAQFAVDQTYNTGLDSAHKEIVAIGRDLEWIRTSDSQKDMEFQALLNKMRDDILVAYDIPLVLFTSADSTFSNLNEAKKMFWTQTLIPIIRKIEESFNTNFFEPLNLPYKLHFKIEEIPELQEDIGLKVESANKLYTMNVPMSIINDVLGLGLPEEGWPGWDAPPPQALPFEFDFGPDQIKEAALVLNKEHKIEEEKKINADEFYKQMEYQKSLSIMLYYERLINKEVRDFFKDKWEEVESYIESNEIKAFEKDIADPNWIERFSYWLRNKSWGEAMVQSLRPIMETVFNRGVFRTYSGIGASFTQSNLRSLDYLINRGLKLNGSPQIVQDTIIDMLSQESFTINELSKAISSKWDAASIARAKNIAITESTAAYNGGRVIGMKELGIDKKQWVHSGDGKVRYSHRISSIIPVDENFVLADGYKTPYPGSGDPAHACNCRCAVVSVL